MANIAWAATRKGLFELQHDGKSWQIGNISFLAEPVSMVLPAKPGERMLAALNLGHFGVKVQASDDGGRNWTESARRPIRRSPRARKAHPGSCSKSGRWNEALVGLSGRVPSLVACSAATTAARTGS